MPSQQVCLRQHCLSLCPGGIKIYHCVRTQGNDDWDTVLIREDTSSNVKTQALLIQSIRLDGRLLKHPKEPFNQICPTVQHGLVIQSRVNGSQQPFLLHRPLHPADRNSPDATEEPRGLLLLHRNPPTGDGRDRECNVRPRFRLARKDQRTEVRTPDDIHRGLALSRSALAATVSGHEHRVGHQDDFRPLPTRGIAASPCCKHRGSPRPAQRGCENTAGWHQRLSRTMCQHLAACLSTRLGSPAEEAVFGGLVG